MGHNLTVISMVSILFVILPIIVLVTNNRVLSARHASTQLQVVGSLVFALLAFGMQSAVALIISAGLFLYYSYRLGQYFRFSLECLRRNTKVPRHRQP